MNREQPESISRSEAMIKITACMHQEMAVGAIDSEKDSFKSILDRLEKGVISPDEAIKEAEQISKFRQDYR